MGTTLANVQQALQIPGFDGVAAQLKMAPTFRPNSRPPDRHGQARLGGVLVLLYCLEGELHLVLTRRREDLNSHAGQISFPGGRNEYPETLSHTALRETQEEIGVLPTAVSLLGPLSHLYIPPSDFEVHPFVGWHQDGKRPNFIPHTHEVAEILEVPLRHLLDPATRREEPWELRGMQVMVPFFDVFGHKVWGATAMMLSEFIERLRWVQTPH